jgi:hypothetical protein
VGDVIVSYNLNVGPSSGYSAKTEAAKRIDNCPEGEDQRPEDGKTNAKGQRVQRRSAEVQRSYGAD